MIPGPFLLSTQTYNLYYVSANNREREREKENKVSLNC